MTILILLGLGLFIYYVLKKGNHSKDSSPKELDPTNIRYYMKDENILPKLEKFNVIGMEWWPSKIEAKDNWYLEKVKFKDLDRCGEQIEVGSFLWYELWYGKQLMPDDRAYDYAFDKKDRDGNYVNMKFLSGKLLKAAQERRMEVVIREIDREEKEINCVIYSYDKPLPWLYREAKGFSIPKKSFEKLVDESDTSRELDEKLREWWKKRDQRAAKRAAKKASE